MVVRKGSDSTEKILKTLKFRSQESSIQTIRSMKIIFS